MRNTDSENRFPRALNAPQDSVVIMDTSLVQKAIAASRKSPRKRVILPLHTESSDTLHRMLNALQPYSYVQPHCHSQPPKPESIIVLRGSIGYLTFGETGQVERQNVLSAGNDRFGIDTKPGIYHTFFALERDTVLFEVKPGPYNEKSDKDFAVWAPAEGAPEARKYLDGLYRRLKED
jgi:cupin fold WbuC family metalloprotein